MSSIADSHYLHAYARKSIVEIKNKMIRNCKEHKPFYQFPDSCVMHHQQQQQRQEQHVVEELPVMTRSRLAVVIVGCTGSGKSKIAIEIAKRIGICYILHLNNPFLFDMQAMI